MSKGLESFYADDDLDAVDEEEPMPEIEEYIGDYTEEYTESGIGIKNTGMELVGKDRRSQPVLGRLALSKLVASRAATLQTNPVTPVTINKDEKWDVISIAKRELVQRVIPIKIIRKFPDGKFEVWPIKDFKYGIPKNENF